MKYGHKENEMTIFKIKGEEKKEEVLEFSLIENDGIIDLKVNNFHLLSVARDGTIFICENVAVKGIKTDNKGRIIIKNFKPCNETPEA